MSIEGARNANDIVTLREHFEALFKQYRDDHEHKHEMLMTNVELAREALDDRLESMNEFRAQILSERGQMMSKDSYESRHEALALRIEANEKAFARLAGIGASVAFLLVVIEFTLRFVLR